MSKNKSQRALSLLLSLAVLFSLFSSTVMAAPSAAPTIPVSFTILHTNDFHGQLEDLATPGRAATQEWPVLRLWSIDVRTAVGADNVLLVDAGDEMQGSLLSNLGDGTPTGKGMPTIATFNAMGYDVATFGNHEFDWGQVNPRLTARPRQLTPM